MECSLLNHYTTLRYDHHRLPPPLVWSTRAQQFIKDDLPNIQLEDQDMLFLYSNQLIELLGDQESLETWLSRPLRHFAQDGLDTIQQILSQELSFLAKKQQIKYALEFISIQVNIPSMSG